MVNIYQVKRLVCRLVFDFYVIENMANNYWELQRKTGKKSWTNWK